MRRRPTRDTMFLPAVFVILLILLVVSTRPMFAQTLPSEPSQLFSDVVRVPLHWDLIPEGVEPGDTFRLLFVSSGERDATSADIADYNAFVRDETAAGHADIQEYKDHFRVLGSTEAVSARVNTLTDPAVNGPGEPIYWLNGPKVAAGYSDLYDGTWDQMNPVRLPSGEAFDFEENAYVFTGTDTDGSASMNPLGGTMNLATTVMPHGTTALDAADIVTILSEPFYGLSGVFQVEDVTPLEVGLRGTWDGELTAEDGGRDWHSFEATAGVQYIIELKGTMVFNEEGGPQFVPGHLVDPSILEVVDGEGEQVLGEHDRGGFTANFARAFFTPEEDGTYFIAVGAGAQGRTLLGFYTLSVRSDDHADDYRSDPSVVLRPGESLSALIDSDVAPDDPGLNPWDWDGFAKSSNGELRPRRGIEMLDDRDVFRIEIAYESLYRLEVTGGPPGVGVWWVWDEKGNLHGYAETAPETLFMDRYPSGTYYVEIGTPYESDGNTGPYTFSLLEEPDDCAPDASTECRLNVGEPREGSVGHAFDFDAWAVRLEAGRVYVIDVRGAGDRSGNNDNGGTLADPFVRLLDSSETSVASNNDVAEDNQNARITYTVPMDAGGTYYIIARTDSGSGGFLFTYTVSVVEVAAALDETEDCAPGSSTGCSMEVGESKLGDIQSERDVDAWAVMLDGPGSYVIYVKGAGEKSGDNDTGMLEDPYASLLDPSGAVVAENDDVSSDDADARIVYTVPKDAGGMHYVVVESRSGKLDGNGMYSITVEDGAV